MEDYGRYDYSQDMNPAPVNVPQSPRKPEKKNKGKWAKKIGAIALSAVLFGGIAGGTFAGIVHVSGRAGKADTAKTENTDANRTTLQNTSAVSNGSLDGKSLDVSDIAESVMPSIVAITNKSVQEVQNYFDMFGRSGGMQQEVESQGSGIIIGKNDEELLIVSNNHVVADADTLSVGFIDNQAYEAGVKGTDAENDLAVIAVKLSDISEDTMSKIKVATVGDSDSLKVGEQVVAIGNALGYGQSVTTGIVSATNRKVGDSESENGFIQTDAAINPGNSGGALLNMRGELIGINSAKLASTEVEGMGYAIPVATAQPILDELMNRETRYKADAKKAAYIGVVCMDVDQDAIAKYGIPKGAFVDSVEEGGPAEAAGIQQGDVITKFDGVTISGKDDLVSKLEYYEAGEEIEVIVSRAENGEYKEQTLTVKLGKRSEMTQTVPQR